MCNRIGLGDVYDGLGEKLEETGDDLNEDTFGCGADSTPNSKAVGNDYDFFGRTARVSDAISKEQARFNSQYSTVSIDKLSASYSQSLSKPARPSHEPYAQPDPVPEMLVDASIWGVNPKRAAKSSESRIISKSGSTPVGRKMMSVEEFESSMLSQVKNSAVNQPSGNSNTQYPPQRSHSVVFQNQYQNYSFQPFDQTYNTTGPSFQDKMVATHFNKSVHNSLRPEPLVGPVPSIIPSKIYSTRQSSCPPTDQMTSHTIRNTISSKYPSGSRKISLPYQPNNLSYEERVALLEDEAKREKRNHKIYLLSKDNGLMTPQDKSFINKIQLQQLVTATGNPNDHGNDQSFTEDFYYQVHNQIHGSARQNLGNTYYIQSGGRYGGLRKQFRGFSNHMQQMEQQVQRAFEAAKNKPKNNQLVFEGSLGKISFSNAKTPKPLLNIKSPETGVDGKAASVIRDRKISQANDSGCDRKTVLTDIENVYNTLMLMEDHDRQIPPRIDGNSTNQNLIALHDEWREKAQKLNRQLWRQLKVHEPVGATTTHPFIAFLSFGKGMKAVPRVFRHISQEQRTTILTIIVLHLDQLDLVRQGLHTRAEANPNAEIREKIELFSLSVMQPLYSFLHEIGLDILTGILGLLLTINIDLIARTKIGACMLTMILSRAELIKQSRTVNEQQEWDQW